MYKESQKIQLIEEVLKIEDADTLNELAAFLKKSKKEPLQEKSIFDFVGVISEKDARKMTTAINDTCEQIHEEDWK